MLELKDFIHLPQVDALFAQIGDTSEGLILVAGLEPRPLAARPREPGIGASGRAAVFGILTRQLLDAHPNERSMVVAETKQAIRIPNRHRRQVDLSTVEPPHTYASLIEKAIRDKVKLMIIERLTAEAAPFALQAASSGMRVLSQLDTVFRGAEVARQLLDWGLPNERLAGLAWIIHVQRLSTLCDRCKQPDQLDPDRLAEIRSRFPAFSANGAFFREGRCQECGYTGRKGDVAAFDIFQAGSDRARLPEASSALPLEEYMSGLAALGYLPVDDVIRLDADQLYRTYRFLTASEEALANLNANLSGKLAELEISNRVLKQQTEASISLQEISHSLITLTGLEDLANYVCRKARDLCDADRGILYHLRPDNTAEVLAVYGWDQGLIHLRLDAERVVGAGVPDNSPAGPEPSPFAGYPPGIQTRTPDLEGARLRAGLRVPLIAQNEVVGLLIFHSTLKPRFSPREVALLQTLANQSALAIQRAGLVEALREKVERLEAAQLEIAKKERLERELELARQVQQSMLPHIFPLVPGFEFAARSEPARQVGGDFYDVFVLDGDRFGIVVADVSDKGMPAALFMALTRSLILAEARRERSPSIVLTRVHELLLELSRPTLYVTVFYGVIDGTTHSMNYVRAGHERPFLLRLGKAEPLQGEGTVLGLLDAAEVRLKEERTNLKPGDRLVLYTDGLIDALAPNGVPFGLGRLVRLLETHSESPLTEMCQAVFTQVGLHQGAAEQYDDMTLLTVQVK